MTRPMSLMIDGWMPSVGSSRTSRRGPAASARAIASCCCWPPERSPPRRLQHLLQHREELEQLGRQLGRARAVGQAHRQVLADGEAGEDLAALRHVADAAADPLVRRLVGDVVAVEQHPARAHRHHAHQALQQRRLADAVAAEHDRDLADPRLERDAAQDVRAAVVLVQRLGLEQRLACARSAGRRAAPSPAAPPRGQRRRVSGKRRGLISQGRPRPPSRRPGPRRASPRRGRCPRAAPSPSWPGCRGSARG